MTINKKERFIMKKLVGFIFMLVASLVLSVTTYAAEDLGSVIAKVVVDKKKDKKKKKKKKKVKKGKKNKKKAKKGKKKAKKVKKDTQSSLKPSEVVEEVLDDYTSNEEEKKDLPVVELRVKSASKIWTNEVDIATLNIEKALNELLIGSNGYPTAPDEVITFDSKYAVEGDLPIEIEASAGNTSNYLVKYDISSGGFEFITKDSLAYFKCFVQNDLDSGSYDLNGFVDRIKTAGLDLSITQKQLDSISKGEIKARFKAGNVYWILTGAKGAFYFSREESKSIEFTMAEVFKACSKHRLVFTNNFYPKFTKLLEEIIVPLDTDNGGSCVYGKKVKFRFSKGTEGELGVDTISYSDNAKYRETRLQISGNINIDTRVSELAKILDEYTGIDLYTFDTSRIENMLKGDAIQEFRVGLERDLGDSKVEISVINKGEETFQFSVTFTRKY